MTRNPTLHPKSQAHSLHPGSEFSSIYTFRKPWILLFAIHNVGHLMYWDHLLHKTKMNPWQGISLWAFYFYLRNSKMAQTLTDSLCLGYWILFQRWLHYDHFTMLLHGWNFNSENDGTAWKSRWSTTSNQWVKTGAVPLVSLEVICSLDEWRIIVQTTQSW